jgi:hypothetical protein
MTERRPCEFLLVRYVPDPVRNEFVNIGVVLRDEEQTVVRFTRDWARVRCMDAGADVGALEAFEEELRARLIAESVTETEKPVLRLLEDSLSASVQLSEAKACLAENAAAEMDELMRLYVEARAREGVQERHPAERGRAGIVRRMRTEFERAGVWPLMRKRIAASAYTQAGDPLQIDCGYRPNGVVKMFHAVTLAGELDAAKVLAYSLPRLAQGMERAEHAKLELTAVVEPLAKIDGEESAERYHFGVETMESAGLRVITEKQLERAAQTAREELRV